MATQPIPEGYHTLIPYLTLDNAAEAIDFYKDAFGATERMRMEAPDGKIGHAELQIGDSILMLADAFPGSTSQPSTSRAERTSSSTSVTRAPSMSGPGPPGSHDLLEPQADGDVEVVGAGPRRPVQVGQRPGDRVYILDA